MNHMLPMQCRDAITDRRIKYYTINKAWPFVRNDRGKLIHRPKAAVILDTPWERDGAYLVTDYYCGGSSLGRHTLHFIVEPSKDEVVCQRCESVAIERGLPSSTDLVGRHVCIGKAKIVKTCGH